MGLTDFPRGDKLGRESPQGGHHVSKEQRTFTKEFKLEAVQFAERSGRSQAQVARDLGIADSTLHHWCKEFARQGSQAFPGSGHQTQQEEELRRLKRELEMTRQERDILKNSRRISA
ncbi:hypothetical protein KSC_092960 [Ktedonobacter sp. SOSP1-52]|uniref:transposase n=1 Tax=Ktedonobacter sp. SOSP1-52 TaxID=2778366 RepID=UPI001A27366F|nr:hypothetical protein KSC_092960 [Ktedonobacter sp. SOSP1-52]